MHRKTRYAIFIIMVVTITGGALYLASQSVGGQRERGLVGPKGPPPR